MLDVKRDVRIFGQERASYLGVPGGSSLQRLAGVAAVDVYPARV
jgi:hypothetical protein